MRCELCQPPTSGLLWQDSLCHVVLVDDSDYPGYCRVIWSQHITEMTDLNSLQQNHLMQMVFIVERALRKHLCPTKINLASLGNRVPHLHWHVIPRFESDPHFPYPIWGARVRQNSPLTANCSRVVLQQLIHTLKTGQQI